MTIQYVDIDKDTAAIMLEASKQTKMTLLEFEAWILKDWARLYKLAQACRFTPQEAKHEVSQRGKFGANRRTDRGA